MRSFHLPAHCYTWKSTRDPFFCNTARPRFLPHRILSRPRGVAEEPVLRLEALSYDDKQGSINNLPGKSCGA